MSQDLSNFNVMEKPYEYFRKLVSLGAFEGNIGNQSLNSELEPAMEIIHKVLAGAKLEVSIKEVNPPNQEMLNELNAVRREAEDQANDINRKTNKFSSVLP